MANFIEGQKALLDLGKQQNEILMGTVKERVGDWPAAHAITEMLQRSFDAFIEMQEEYLKIAGKQSHTWVEAAKAGKPYQGEHVMELARDGMQSFVKAQKQFLDIIAEETTKATTGRRTNGAGKKVKKTELAEVARQTAESFMEAQKKLVDVVGKQMNANVKAAGKAVDLLAPFPLPLAELTREGVRSYVDAQKALMDVMSKPVGPAKHAGKKERHAKRPMHARKHVAAEVVA
jgi:hypothetical protein